MALTRLVVLPALLALAALATAGSGVAAAGSLREDARAEQAAAAATEQTERVLAEVAAETARQQAEKAARDELEQAFRVLAAPVVERVYDAVQPLSEAEGQFDDDANGGFSAYVDVSRLPSTGAGIAAAKKALAGLEPPSSLATDTERVIDAATQLETAARLYREIPFDGPGDDAFGDATDAALTALEIGVERWAQAVGELFPTDGPTVMTSPRSTLEPGRRPVSQGAYVLAVDRACGKAASVEGDDEVPTEPAAFAAAARVEAAVLRTTIESVLAVAPPKADAGRLDKAVLAPLRDAVKGAAALEELGVATAAGDLVRVEAAAADFATAVRASDRAATGLRAYGADACADTFEG